MRRSSINDVQPLWANADPCFHQCTAEGVTVEDVDVPGFLRPQALSYAGAMHSALMLIMVITVTVSCMFVFKGLRLQRST